MKRKQSDERKRAVRTSRQSAKRRNVMSDRHYPEHEKLAALNGANETVGAFIEWMQHARQWTIAAWREAGNNGEPRFRWREGRTRRKQFHNRLIRPDDVPDGGDEYNGDAEANPDYDSWDAGYYAVLVTTQDMLAEYFGIDRDRLESEKRQMLDEIRSAARADREQS